MNFNKYEGIKQTLFPVKEKAATLAGMETGYKFIVREDTNDVISCVTDKYKLITNKEIMDVALPILKDKGGTLKETKVFNNARTMWKFRFKDTKVEIAKGDFVNPEVIIRNSYDGSTEVQAMGGAYRLVCSNGMVIGYTIDKKSERHTVWNEGHNISDVINSVIHSVQTVFDNDFPLMVDTNVKKSHVMKVIKLFPSEAISSFTDHMLKEKPKTYWDLLNAATWTATHAMKRDREATHNLESKIYPLVKKLVKSSSIAKA